MSIRIATATSPTQRSIAQHKAPKIVGIAGLLAAVLTANIADAATSSQSRASMPERSWTADYAPAYPSRYDRGMSAASQGRGIFEERNSAP